MYARVMIMTVKDPTAQSPQAVLKEFADSLYYHPLYAPLVNELKARDGYCERVHALIDAVDNVKYISQVVFSSKETLENYVNDESTINLWNLIIQLADQDGITITAVDTDKFLRF